MPETQAVTKPFGGKVGGYSVEERVVIHLQKARALLDEANAIEGDAHWKGRAGQTKEQNAAARTKHNTAHRAVEHCSALLWHTEFKGRLTPAQQEQAAALFAEAKRVRGY